METKELSDLGLIAALIALEIHPKSKRLQGKKAIFVFETNKEFELLCKDYFNKVMIGDFYSYNKALRKVRSSVYQMKETKHGKN